MWWHAVEHALGLDSGSGPIYLAWSGPGADLSELTLLGGIVAIYRKHNCHRHRCWRLGHFDFTDSNTGLSYKLCARDHPAHSGRHLTAGRIAFMHARNVSADDEED